MVCVFLSPWCTERHIVPWYINGVVYNKMDRLGRAGGSARANANANAKAKAKGPTAVPGNTEHLSKKKRKKKKLKQEPNPPFHEGKKSRFIPQVKYQ